jgi:hypothetical protein
LETAFIDHLYTRLLSTSNYSATAISIIHKAPQHPLSFSPTCCFCNSRSLSTAFNSGDSSGSRSHAVTVRRISLSSFSRSRSHIATDGQSVSMSWCRAPSGDRDQIFITVWQSRCCFCGAPSLTRGRVCLLYCPLPLQSFSGPSPLGLATIFYCPRFETSFSSPPTTRRVTVEVFDPAFTRVVCVSSVSSQSQSHSAGLGSSLYSLEADPKGNTASNSFSIAVMGGCLAIAWISFTCLPSNGSSSSRSLHCSGTTRYKLYWVNLNTYRISKDKILLLVAVREKDNVRLVSAMSLFPYSKIMSSQEIGKTFPFRAYHGRGEVGRSFGPGLTFTEALFHWRYLLSANI